MILVLAWVTLLWLLLGDYWHCYYCCYIVLVVMQGRGSAGVIRPLRFVKVKQIHVTIRGLSKIPQGQPGAGNTPWLFLDEIEIR